MKKLLLPLVAALALCAAPGAFADNVGAGCSSDVHQVLTNVNLDVHSGATSTATFTIPASCSTAKISFVSYTASSPTFTWQNASDEVVYDQVTQNLPAGTHTLSVNTPNCYFQLDLVLGDVIAHFGPYDTNPNNFYTPQGVLGASSNGGSQSCTPPAPTPPPTPPTPPTPPPAPPTPPTVIIVTTPPPPPPAPPAPPVVIDVCSNIEGVQTQTPDNMTHDDATNTCNPIVDVCPNIEGIQTKTPDDMIVDSQGNCVTPPQDVCSNLAGVQTQVPQGYSQSGSICSKPVKNNFAPPKVKAKPKPKKTVHHVRPKKPKGLPYTP